MRKGALYGDTTSRAFRCIWSLSDLSFEYEQNQLNLKKGKALTSNFLKMNPIGPIPVQKDDSGRGSESMEIFLWVAEKDKTKNFFKAEINFHPEVKANISIKIDKIDSK